MSKESSQALIGAHTSGSKGLWNAILHGTQIGATCIQMFTSNQRQWQGKEVTEDIAKKFQSTMKQSNISHVMSHGSYLVNLASSDEQVRMKSRQVFKEELIRCQKLGVTYLNFHPGSHLKRDPKIAMDNIIEAILELEDLVKQGPTQLVFESTAGQGTNLGYKFEELRYLVDGIKDKIDIGICLDTCHMFAAGYDIRDAESFEKTFEAFDNIVGLKYLVAFHVNDSKSPLGSRVDRHEKLGYGYIGWKAFEILMQHPKTKHIPKYLETPDSDVWKEEIDILRNFFDGKTVEELNLPIIKLKEPEPKNVKKRKRTKEETYC